MKIFSELATLIFEKKCHLCFATNLELDSRLGICLLCFARLKSCRNIVNRGSIRVFAGSEFSPAISHIILAAKEGDNRFARLLLAEYLSSALKLATAENSVFLIPIPSRRAADRARGFSHVIKLVKQLELLNSEVEFNVVDCLRHSRKISDQSTLNIHERELNMKGAFAIAEAEVFRFNKINLSKSPIFLVDDLVTTGSTVLAANRALKGVGIVVKGVLTSCATNGFTH